MGKRHTSVPEKNAIRQPYRILNYSKICQVAQLRMGRGRYEDRLRRALLIDPHTLSSPIA